MSYSPEFRELLDSIRAETTARPLDTIPGIGVMSRIKHVGQFTLNCVYTDENMLSFDWNEEGGTRRSDKEIAYVLFYEKSADDLTSLLPQDSYHLTVDGSVIERSGSLGREACATTIGFLIGLLSRSERT